MKKYQKPNMIAKNLPTGSYAAGCPSNYRGEEGCWVLQFDRGHGCASCDRAE